MMRALIHCAAVAMCDQSVVEFLFNLHDATLIDAKSFEADQSGRGGQYSKIDLTSDCVSKSSGRINTL